MKTLNKLRVIACLLCLFTGVIVTESHGEEPLFNKKIVVFHEWVLWGEVQEYADEWEEAGVSVITELPLINGLVLKVPAFITSSELRADPRVLGVEENQKVRIQGVLHYGGLGFFSRKDKAAEPTHSVVQPVPKPPSYHRPWGVLRLYNQLRHPDTPTGSFDHWRVPKVIKKAWWHMALRQKLRVAILDTGADASHPDLSRVLKGGFDVTTMTPGVPRDDNGHGTHIAGTILSVIGSAEFWAAPPVDLFAVKILDRYTYGDLYNIVLGLQWAVRHGMDVVNMSLSYRDDSLAVRLAIKKAYEAGLILVAAAGNHSNWDAPPLGAAVFVGAADGGAADGGAADGGAADGGAADGGAADGGAADGGAADGGAADGGAADGGAGGGTQGAIPRYSVMYPARYLEVISVGASTPFRSMASFSNSGPDLDVTAPGTGIVSAALSKGRWRAHEFAICSGTSMATAHVTAAVVFMLAIDPQLSGQEIRELLWETADGLRNYDGAGDLNLIKALESLLSSSGPGNRR